ncbi:MAG TPA: pyrroloquinoline quinone biosynthesis peptide chaperone PqqD [Amycolatopsis sp.]|nr:pyrroloquinoline quinone biosynthesis peptide chaperone PqqD [Amycolatopsis sp.]
MSMTLSLSSARPRLAPHVRLMFDRVRARYVLQTPETVTVLNGTGAAILQLCEGKETVDEIVATLRGRYDRVRADEVRSFVARLVTRGYLEPGGD